MSKMNVLLIAAATSVLGTSIGWQTAQAQEPFKLTMDANSVWVRAGESPVLQYRYSGVPFKPYIKELYTPGGINVLLDAPPDHLHHHGLMFAVAVDGVNFWEETPTAGRQMHAVFDDVNIVKRFGNPSVGFPVAQFKERIAWRDATPQVRLIEQRLIDVCQTNTPGTSAMATVLTWQSKFEVPKGKPSVTLAGSHYFGLGMRFPRSMDGTGEFLNADGKEGTIFRGEERLVQSNWCAYQVTADGKPVTIAMFGSLKNPRGATTWFTMAKPFAYMSATLGLHAEALEVRASLPLRLRYGVAIWDRHVLPAQINAYYQEWSVADWQMVKVPLQPTNQTDKTK
jgi:hypothetical protein